MQINCFKLIISCDDDDDDDNDDDDVTAVFCTIQLRNLY